ncbi:MAG: GTPase ObgE [Eubacteriales bacterium]
MFVDKVRIFIKAGNGGDGCVSFHREKYVPNGGPDGGDGGNGGNIVFRASKDMRTLLDFRYKIKFAAENGMPGKKSNMRGQSGADLIIDVPPGTIVKDYDTGKVVADIRTDEKKILLYGGTGGKGNSRFKTATRQAPSFSTPGIEKKGHWVILELKSIADVGLIGFPNVGKSTFLSMATAAKPKIANYHFTTLTPNLGVASVNNFSFIIADIPGLIEGAHEGAGLGHDFLRHIERTRMLLHVIDISGIEGRDPIKDYKKIREELKLYSPELLKKQEVVAANKTDIPGAEDNLNRLREALKEKGVKVFPISCATGEGIKELLSTVSNIVKELPQSEIIGDEGVIEEWKLDDELSFDIEVLDGRFIVTGNLVDHIFKRTNPNDERSMRHFQKLLVDFGIIKKLKEKGIKNSDTVQLNEVEFDFYD